MNKWIVHIKDFGKIEKADIEVAPLTLFVGDNNSGKSYLMTLIYGLLNLRFWADGFQFRTDSEVYRNCRDILDEMMRVDDDSVFVLDQRKWILFENLLNELLMDNQKQFLLRLFNREMNLGEFWISFPKDMELTFKVKYRIWNQDKKEGFSFRLLNDPYREVTGCLVQIQQLRENEVGYQFLMSYIMQSMLQGGWDIADKMKNVYLPTTRTGFLLTYKTLIGSAVQEKFTLEKTDKNLLTKPNSDFLRELGGMDTTEEKGRFQTVIKFIENHVISGHISVSETPAQDLVYLPEGSDQKLPLYVSSAVVTEMTPLLLFLKYVNIGTLLFEEPEISLHPQLQWQIARVLIRLTNMGLPVFITTHSDLILQHINNMIKANEMDKQKDFLNHSDYEKEDLLSRKQICVYQFDVQENGMTNVHRLPCGDYGFEAETFYHTLEKMNSEIEEIEKEV